MADPLLYQITTGTLKNLKDGITFDSLFKGNPLFDYFEEWSNAVPEWEKITRRRMKAMNIPILRRDEIISEMRKARGEPEPAPFKVHVSEVGSWDGGNVIEEPITYGKLERCTTKT